MADPTHCTSEHLAHTAWNFAHLRSAFARATEHGLGEQAEVSRSTLLRMANDLSKPLGLPDLAQIGITETCVRAWIDEGALRNRGTDAEPAIALLPLVLSTSARLQRFGLDHADLRVPAACQAVFSTVISPWGHGADGEFLALDEQEHPETIERVNHRTQGKMGVDLAICYLAPWHNLLTGHQHYVLRLLAELGSRLSPEERRLLVRDPARLREIPRGWPAYRDLVARWLDMHASIETVLQATPTRWLEELEAVANTDPRVQTYTQARDAMLRGWLDRVSHDLDCLGRATGRFSDAFNVFGLTDLDGLVWFDEADFFHVFTPRDVHLAVADQLTRGSTYLLRCPGMLADVMSLDPEELAHLSALGDVDESAAAIQLEFLLWTHQPDPAACVRWLQARPEDLGRVLTTGHYAEFEMHAVDDALVLHATRLSPAYEAELIAIADEDYDEDGEA